MEESQRSANEKLRKRPFIGSGLAALHKSAFGSKSTMGSVAQNLLRNLFHQHGVEINDEAAESSWADKVYGYTVADPDIQAKSAALVDTPDADIQKRAKAGEISLFLTILQIIDDNPAGPIPTKELFKTCCLAVNPADVPGSMDAKEMVMGALQFLSREFESNSHELVSLPLIRPAQELADLERRTFHKHGDWTLNDTLKEQVWRLEQIFVSSPSNWKWLKREFHSPRLSSKDEISFFLKGAIPASAAGKRVQKEPTSRKRKATSPAPAAARSSSPASVAAETVVDSSEPVVEATVVADDDDEDDDEDEDDSNSDS